MNLVDIQKLFAYTEWANHLTLDAVEKLTVEQQRQNFNISHGSIFGTLVHTAAAEWVWLERWQGVSPTALWRVEEYDDLAHLRVRWQQVEANRQTYLASLTDADLERLLEFRLLSGQADALPLGAQMQHVVNHSTLHRGQVVGMIRQLGIVPPATDYLFYLRAIR